MDKARHGDVNEESQRGDDVEGTLEAMVALRDGTPKLLT